MRVEPKAQERPVAYFADLASELSNISISVAEITASKEKGRVSEYRGLRAREGEILRDLTSSTAADYAGLRRKALACLVPPSIENSELAAGAFQSLALDLLRIVKAPAEAAAREQSLASEQSTRTTQLLDAKSVAAMLGVSKVTVYAWMRDKHFPCPLAISEKCVRWRVDEVMAWINALPRTSAAQLK